MTHRPGCARLALAGLLLPALAAAAPTAHHSHASLDVTRRASAAHCPSEKDVRRDVTAILGYVPFDKNARRRVSAVLWAAGGTYHARIQLKDARTQKSLGFRELSAAGLTCEELGQAMALAIALAIDPLAQPPPPRVVAVRPAPDAAATGAAAAGTAALAAPLPGGISSSAGASASPRPAPAQPPTRGKPPPPAPKLAQATLPDAGVKAPPPVPVDAGAAPPDAGEVSDAGASPPDAGALAEVPPDAGPLAPPPAVDAGAPAPVEAPPTPVVATAVAVPAATPPEPPPPPETRPFHGIAGAGAEWTVGLVPQRAFGVFVHGGVALPHFLGEVEVGWLPSTSFAYPPGHISTALWTGALVACGTFSGFGVCGVVQTGPLTSQGTGYGTNSSTTTWLFALGVRGQWDWVFAHPVGLRLQATGLYNAVQTRLQVGTGPGGGSPLTAWTAPVFALSLGAGLFVVF